MISNADLGIAMKNSLPSVRKFANKITEYDNNNSGVGKTVFKLLTDREFLKSIKKNKKDTNK